jgi:2-dehydro-3-deoxygluconokinase
VPRFDVTTIGEGQLRFCVPAGKRLETVDCLDVHACGTEANVVSLLSRLGWNCGWVSSLPRTPLGRRVANQFKLSGLDLSAVRWADEGRVATYYVEYAGPPRSTQVYYDRANSCFANLKKDDIDWDYLTATRILHLSGLTVPLSPDLSDIVKEAVRQAKARGVKVSFDLNYRRRIWSPEQARESLLPIIKDCDILFCSRTDAHTVLGIEGDPQVIVRRLAEVSNAKFIVSSLSQDGLIGWNGDHFLHQPACCVDIIDRIGAGDAMVAGILHGLLTKDFAQGIRYGAIAAALALTQYGDQVITSREELESLAATGTSPDICR